MNDTEFCVKIRNLTLVRKRGVLSTTLDDCHDIDQSIMQICKSASSYYKNHPGVSSQAFFNINNNYKLGILIDDKVGPDNPYLFIYDVKNKKLLKEIEYDDIIELKDNDIALSMTKSMHQMLDKGFCFINLQKETTDKVIGVVSKRGDFER